ncbi:1666_t:CDS:1 [Dentiscutata erythropus]|uniref:1666_t:CDS:1 n=1 Tax=Dentiscutata erythropus TaxID=1348616 RepID=A0A9N9K2J9_9GLOM|nr:1666_t:CDS:1 [Dentiscutata erythropus]
MPCCIDTIVKVSQVRQTDRDESNFAVVWALCVYPIDSEDREMEVVLFVPVNDPNIQSVFVKGEYYSVCVVEDLPKEIDSESAMFKLLVNDYAGKNYSFTIKIVFPFSNSRFKYLMNSIRSNESVLFVVGHIKEDLYVYAADTSFVEVSSTVKRKISSSSSSQVTSEVYRSVRARLLTAHQNANEKSSLVSSAEVDKCLGDSVTNASCSRHVRVEDVDDEDCYVKNADFDYGVREQIVECNKECLVNGVEDESGVLDETKGAIRGSEKQNKGKEKVTQFVVHNTRSRADMVKGVNEER